MTPSYAYDPGTQCTQLEAEEKACAVASECVESEEEGPEVYDPEGLASYKKTLKRSKQLHSDAGNAVLIGLALNIGVPGATDGGAAYADALTLSADALELCVGTGKALGGRAGKWGTCYIHEYRAEKWGIGVPLFATAEFCEYVTTRQWGKKAHPVYYCADAKVDRWGPWF